MTDFLEQLEHELVAGYRRGRTARRGAIARRAVGTGVGTAAIVAVVVLVAGHTPAERSVVPTARPAALTTTLLSLRVADPAGGLPWGLQEVRYTTGPVCLQYGRIKDGAVGTLGADGSFHRLAASKASDCQLPDAAGHAFMVTRVHGISQTADEHACNVERNCRRTDVRIVNYGLLGPDAERITYRGPGGTPVDQTVSSPDGGFLIVRRPRASDRLSGSYTPGVLAAPDVLSRVRYTDGTVCRPHKFAECPARGFVRSTFPVPTAAQVRAPVHTVVRRTTSGTLPVFRVTVSVRARYAAKAGAVYVFQAAARHGGASGCTGYLGAVPSAVPAGQRVAQTFVFDRRCRAVTATVGYQPAPESATDANAYSPDMAGTVPVGQVRVRLR